MRRAWLLLILLAAPLAAAQDEPRPSLSLVPTVHDLPPGGRLDVTLKFSNPRAEPLVLLLSFLNDDGVAVDFSAAKVEVPARGHSHATATVEMPAQTARPQVVRFVAEEPPATDAKANAPLRLEATLELRPLVRPSIHVLDASAENATELTTTGVIRNPQPKASEWRLSALAPPELRVRFEPEVVLVGAQGSAPFRVHVTGERGFRAESIEVRATEIDGSAQANGRAPLTLRTTFRADAAMLRPIDAPPSPAWGLRVVPALVEIPEGGSAQATLVLANGGPTTAVAEIVLTLPHGVRANTIPIQRVPGGGRVEVPVRLVHEGAPAIERGLDAAARIVGTDAAASFRIRVTPPVGPPEVPAGDAAVASAAEAPGLDPRIVTAGAVAAVAGGWSALWLTRRQWWPLLLALYTRLRPSRILDHPVRKRIADAVQREPGITFSDLARAVGIAPGQLTHHARMLERAGVVFSSPDGQTRRFYHVGAGRLAPVPPLSERALTLVAERPRTTSELARDLGVSRQALHYHVKQLVAQGKLVASPRGRELWLEASAPGARVSST